MAPERNTRSGPAVSSETDTDAEVTQSASAPDPISEQRAPDNSEQRAPDKEPAAGERFPAEEEPQAQPEKEQQESEKARGGEDHEAQLEHDLEELAARAGKADEYLELAKRTKADFENYRKRAAREAAAAQQRGVVKLAQELLPAVDDLDRAVMAAQAASAADNDGTSTLISGIKLVHADVIAALARVGIEPYSPVGEPFDPQHHEAVAQQPVEGAKPGTVVEVYQRGYRLHDGSVLRPARVVVAA